MDEKQLSVSVERVRSQFAEWRAHKSRGDRIPERLWLAAVEVAQRHGVHAVSRALRLEHSALRRRVENAGGLRTETAAFIELADLSAAESAGCVVELEKGNGTRMRICVRDGAAVDWSRMKEAFLGA
jgi:hypothetical protein